jgi:Holliday junction resolvase RusA-like endonuclease
MTQIGAQRFGPQTPGPYMMRVAIFATEKTIGRRDGDNFLKAIQDALTDAAAITEDTLAVVRGINVTSFVTDRASSECVEIKLEAYPEWNRLSPRA